MLTESLSNFIFLVLVAKACFLRKWKQRFGCDPLTSESDTWHVDHLALCCGPACCSCICFTLPLLKALQCPFGPAIDPHKHETNCHFNIAVWHRLQSQTVLTSFLILKCWKCSGTLAGSVLLCRVYAQLDARGEGSTKTFSCYVTWVDSFLQTVLLKGQKLCTSCPPKPLSICWHQKISFLYLERALESTSLCLLRGVKGLMFSIFCLRLLYSLLWSRKPSRSEIFLALPCRESWFNLQCPDARSYPSGASSHSPDEPQGCWCMVNLRGKIWRHAIKTLGICWSCF